jgi:hypothetical protein
LADQLARRHRAKNFSETEAIAFDLCAHIFRRGKTAGRYAISIEELRQATGLHRSDLQHALDLAADRAWIEYVGLLLALRAAGIYAAKTALDLPR